MTPSMEKLFFNFILKNKKYFDVVKPYFFRNSEIQFVYAIIREYMIKSDAQIPTPRQILDMTSLEDKEGVITKEILKSILQVDLKEYDEKNFILVKILYKMIILDLILMMLNIMFKTPQNLRSNVDLIQ